MKSFLFILFGLLAFIQVSLCVNCPPGWYNQGTNYCKREKLYGNGGGFGWNLGDGWTLDKAYRRCAIASGRRCQQIGMIWYPRCDDGYQFSGCCLCKFNRCPLNYQFSYDFYDGATLTAVCRPN